jgi:hypothetical protein
MARYINYDDLIKKWQDLGFDKISKIHKINALNHFIKNLPTADVVEVCRCHECKYGDNGIQKQEVYTVCNRFGNGILKMSPLDFCSYGERRTDNDV